MRAFNKQFANLHKVASARLSRARKDGGFDVKVCYLLGAFKRLLCWHHEVASTLRCQISPIAQTCILWLIMQNKTATQKTICNVGSNGSAVLFFRLI